MTHARERWRVDEKMMDQMKTFATDAAKTEGVGNTPLVPTIGADGTKEFTITAEITKWEVEPGKIVDAWTYNGRCPARGSRSTWVTRSALKLVNKLHDEHRRPPARHPHPEQLRRRLAVHPADDHAGRRRSPTSSSPTSRPSACTTPTCTARRRCRTACSACSRSATCRSRPAAPCRASTIPDDVKIVQEIPMVLNDAGVIGLSLNGKSFPATAPVVVNQGDWFVVHYFNEGLQNHPMHLHGFPQLIIAKDGIPLDQPYWADTILIGPGERYTVLVHATDVGTWVWHCHILNHVEMKDRLFGMVTAVVVQDPNAAA